MNSGIWAKVKGHVFDTGVMIGRDRHGGKGILPCGVERAGGNIAGDTGAGFADTGGRAAG